MKNLRLKLLAKIITAKIPAILQVALIQCLCFRVELYATGYMVFLNDGTKIGVDL
jgi:hypothetical protein